MQQPGRGVRHPKNCHPTTQRSAPKVSGWWLRDAMGYSEEILGKHRQSTVEGGSVGSDLQEPRGLREAGAGAVRDGAAEGAVRHLYRRDRRPQRAARC